MPHTSLSHPVPDRDRLRAIANTHTWVGAAELPLSTGQASTANLRAALTIRADTKVHILDAYCARCKATWEAVKGIECAAGDTQTGEYLRGGPIGVRKKRGKQPRRNQETS